MSKLHPLVNAVMEFFTVFKREINAESGPKDFAQAKLIYDCFYGYKLNKGELLELKDALEMFPIKRDEVADAVGDLLYYCIFFYKTKQIIPRC